MAQKNKKVPQHNPEPKKLDAKTAEKPADIPSEPAAVPEISPRSFPNLEAPVANPEVKTPNISVHQKEIPEMNNQEVTNTVPVQHAEKTEIAPALSKESILEDTPATEYTLPEEEKKSGKKPIIIGIFIVLIIAGIALWFFLNFKKEPRTAEKKVETSEIQENELKPSPEAEPTAVFDRTKFTIEILNGSGIAGAAKKIADKLSVLGYEIIKLGNADEVDKTQVYLSSEMESFKSEFLKDLEADLKEATISGELKDSTASARIIIGKE